MGPSNFESFLQRIFREAGLQSQTELAEALGINRSAVTQARRKDSVPARWILQLHRRYGFSPQWIEFGNGPVFSDAARDGDAYTKVPKVKARLSAGGGSFEIGSEIQGYYSFRQDWMHTKGAPEHMVLMDIFGNSMEPELKDGDTVLIDTSQKDILAGAIYAVGVDDTILVKRIEKHPQKLVLLSDNKDYAPVYLAGGDSTSVRVIGKVLWVGREFR